MLSQLIIYCRMDTKKENNSYPATDFLSSNPLPFYSLPQPLTPQHYYALTLHPFSIPQALLAAAQQEGRGKWGAVQQRQYINFLQSNLDVMSTGKSRKANRVFLKMAKIIGTRSADQCRSHHQKTKKYHSSVQDIISSYRRRYPNALPPYLKNQPTTAPDQDEPSTPHQHSKFLINPYISHFYQIKCDGNTFTITIDQSALETYHL